MATRTIKPKDVSSRKSAQIIFFGLFVEGLEERFGGLRIGGKARLLMGLERGRRMGCRVDLLQQTDEDLGIDLRRVLPLPVPQAP